MKRNNEQAIRDVMAILVRQLPRGYENAARHIVGALNEIGREPEPCGAVCPEQPDWVCGRSAGHTGRHESAYGDWYDEREPCVACNGTGFVHGECCRRCEGSMSRPKEGF